MDFYALYPCTITDLEAVKAAEKKENVYCEHLKERIRAKKNWMASFSAGLQESIWEL